MASISQVPTPERGTRIIIPTFTDEAGTVLTFGQLTTPIWSLTTKVENQVVNSRSNVALAALYIVLTNSDLAIFSNDLWRIITIECQYNSATYGNGLYLKAQYEFPIEDLKKVQ